MTNDTIPVARDARGYLRLTRPLVRRVGVLVSRSGNAADTLEAFREQ